MMTPLVSVVVATRNRAASLPEALSVHERCATRLAWELVVVDNGSTDTTAEVLRDFAGTTRIPFRAVFEPRTGLSCARNAGWRAARGELIAFTDDDCYPDVEFVDAIARCFADRHVDYLGGRITLHDPDDAPVTIQLREEPLRIPPRSFVRAGLIHGANMAARRHVLEILGGFDEMLGAGTRFPSEDLDFVSRAAAAGFEGGYDPRPVVAHHHRRSDPGEVEVLRHGYDVGRGAYYAKCLCDPRRRVMLWRWWIRKLPHTIAVALRSPRIRRQLAAELHGAIACVHEQANQRGDGPAR
jgi:glycosyltransferase involved in cell wall biosynthesis